jgi:hypothetical protein
MGWQVQAMLIEGPPEPFAYAPTWHRWRWQAKREIRALEASFPPGWIEVRVTPRPRAARP